VESKVDKQIKERGIIFNGEMVRAILDGRKTQTRRVIKNQREGDCWSVKPAIERSHSGHTHDWWLPKGTLPYSALPSCPFGQVGDRLWVREAWQAIHDSVDEFGCVEERTYAPSIPKVRDDYWRAVYAECFGNESIEDRGFPWRPSIHMPRWASRITLEITDIRVERLQDISEEDAKSEGAPTECCVIGDKHFLGFRSLWKSIYGQDSWQSNPFVWVVKFKRVEEA